MRALALMVFCAGLSITGVAEARQQPPPSSPAAAPSPEAVALARRYIAAMHMDQSLKPMMLSMVEAMVQQQAQRYPSLTDSQRNQLAGAVNAAVREVYDRGLFDRMAEKMIPGMATVFSIQELKALAEFYESPTGQSVIAKMPAFGEISGKAVMELMPEMQKDLQTAVDKNIEALKLGG